MKDNDMFILKVCPVCGGESFADFLVCKDHTVSGELFKIVDCRDCDCCGDK